MIKTKDKRQNGSLFSIIPFIILNLSGCDDESYESSLNSLPPLPEMNGQVSAENNNQQGLTNTVVLVDVNEHIRAPVGSDIKLKNVTLINNNSCGVNSIQNHHFSVQTDAVDDCIFEYEVVSQLNDEINSTTAIVRLAVGDTYQNEKLPRITKQTTLNQPVSIDLNYELLNEGIDSSDHLDTELTVIGSGEANIVKDNIVVFEPKTLGTTEIYYTYKSTSNVKQGIISVSASEEGDNTPPKVTDFEQNGLVNLDDTVVIDVASYVEDIDGDATQLVSIDDFNSSSSLFAPTDINNTKFYFNASVPGSHDVAYTVSDHMGGYSTAIVHINVEPDFSLIQDWEDIVVYDPIIDSDIRFLAPMTKIYADYVNANYIGTVIEDGSYGDNGAEIVTMTLEQARGYCKVRGGRLPLTRELNTLFTTEGNLYSEHNWPTSQSYWTADKVSEQDAATLYLYDGVLSSVDKKSASYVTCVDLSNRSVKDFSSSVTFLNNERNEYIHEISVIDPDGNDAKFQDIVLKNKNETGVFSNGKSTLFSVVDETGKKNLSYFDTSFNTTPLFIEVSSDNSIFVFVPDLSSATLNTTDPLKWNFVDIRYGQTDELPLIDSRGIPTLFPDSSGVGTSSVYVDSFVGEDFVIAMHISNTGDLNAGATSFFLEQVGAMPDQSWYDTNRTQPGSPMTGDSFNIVTNYFSDTYYIYKGFDNLFVTQDTDVNKKDIFMWFQKKGDYLYYFASENNSKPEDPEFVLLFEWGEIDHDMPYWVGVGGSSNYTNLDVRIVSASFSAYL